MEKFNNCPQCDFEWHPMDGSSCPVCQSHAEYMRKETEHEQSYLIGVFGSGKNRTRMKKIYQALGLLALVYFLYALFGGR
jgi:hypothetical protein